MDGDPNAAGLQAGPPQAAMSNAELLAALEALSRGRPDRLLRLRGRLPAGAVQIGVDAAGPRPDQAVASEPFELLIFRGFSSLTTHPTAFDPDCPALPEQARISGAELLAAPLDPEGVPLAGPAAAALFLVEAHWL